MKIIKGTVVDHHDSQESGRFWASFKFFNQSRQVIYTSPMYRANGGGVLAFPSTDDEILVVYDDQEEKLYYHSTIVDNWHAREFGSVIPDPKFYSEDGQPVKVNFQNQAGAGLEIQRNNRPAPATSLCSVTLKSEKGKKVVLDDSPKQDGVFIKNQHGDGIIVKGNRDDTFMSRCIQIKSKGDQDYISMKGDIIMKVAEGRDVTIVNTSTGVMNVPISPLFWPNITHNLPPIGIAATTAAGATPTPHPESQPPKRWGGVYVRSVNGDASVISNAADGRIFITTPKARIQITETGDIEINAPEHIDLQNPGVPVLPNITIKAAGDIDLQGKNINIKALGSLNMESGFKSSILSRTGTIDLTSLLGSINLNSIIPTFMALGVGYDNVLQGIDPLAILRLIKEPDLNDYYE